MILSNAEKSSKEVRRRGKKELLWGDERKKDLLGRGKKEVLFRFLFVFLFYSPVENHCWWWWWW